MGSERQDPIPSGGIKVVCVTPFTETGALDEEALASEVDRLAAYGLAIYMSSFGSGEGHLLDDAENRRVLEVAVAAAAGRAPVVSAAVGFTDTARVRARISEAADVGADAVQVMPPRPGPPNVPPPLEELDSYYDDVLADSPTAIHLTNEGFMVGYSIPVRVLVELTRRHACVTEVNTTDVDPWHVVELVDALEDGPAVYTGLLTQLPLALSLGATGALGFEAVIAPELMLDTLAAFRAGDLDGFRRGYSQALRLHRVLTRYGNPRSIKAALSLMGVLSARCRRPYLPLPPDALDDIRSILDGIGL